LIVPWQSGYAGYQISDGYVAVDDMDGSNPNGYYRCEINGWPEGASVTEHCDAIVGFDFDKFDFAGSSFMGRTASNKAFSFAGDFLGNLNAGSYYESKNSLFYYGDLPIEIGMKDFNASDARYIKIYADDSLTDIKQEGYFVPSPSIGSLNSIAVISNGEYILFSKNGEDAQECKLEFGPFNFIPNAQDSSIDSMLQEVILGFPEGKALLENYPSLPSDIVVASTITQEAFGFEITSSMTDSEFKQAIDDAWLTEFYTDWLANYHAALERNAEKYPDEYFHCIENPKAADPFLVASMFGSLAFVDDYLYGSTGNSTDTPALSTYVYNVDSGYQYLSGKLANFLTKEISEEKISTIRNAIIAEYSGFSAYPELSEIAKEMLLKPNLPEDMESRMKALYADAMQSVILSKLSYFNFGTFASVADDHSSVLLGEALSSDVSKGMFGFTGRASKKSYLLLFNDIENDEVSISVIPREVTIDPYANQASQFSIDVSGTNIYGLDVSCNLSSASLSVTQASYNGLFGSQNSMTLPLMYSASSVTGTETLVAPELPFAGTGSFVLADVIADFTTEDVQITCAAEISDENGQLLQVALTPATIRIDDGVHGGSGSVSGVIEISGVSDYSGIEVVLTIDGRQVTVITDEAGRFEFDGLRDGEFIISLASENYVQSCQAANVEGGAAVDLGSIELLAGDVNADGRIDIADFTFMAARYRSNQGDADYDAKADLNKDGTINIQDLAILGSHFGSTQCNPLQ